MVQPLYSADNLSKINLLEKKQQSTFSLSAAQKERYSEQSDQKTKNSNNPEYQKNNHNYLTPGSGKNLKKSSANNFQPEQSGRLIDIII